MDDNPELNEDEQARVTGPKVNEEVPEISPTGFSSNAGEPDIAATPIPPIGETPEPLDLSEPVLTLPPSETLGAILDTPQEISEPNTQSTQAEIPTEPPPLAPEAAVVPEFQAGANEVTPAPDPVIAEPPAFSQPDPIAQTTQAPILMPPAVEQPTDASTQTGAVVAPTETQTSIPAAVLALSDTDLRIAATYYLQKHQATISRKGVEARRAQMQRNLDTIRAFVSSEGNAQIPRIARKLNLSPGLVSHYLQILVRQGSVKAEGHAKTRRYFV